MAQERPRWKALNAASTGNIQIDIFSRIYREVGVRRFNWGSAEGKPLGELEP
jgi:hypothetical protein